MGSESSILFEVDEVGVGILTLNRPDKLNAFDEEMIDLWHKTLVSASADDNVNVVLVIGAGRAFCAGGDVDHMLTYREQRTLKFKDFLWRHVHRIALTLERMEKPVIAALNGTARGAGLDMALMCDLRIAAESAVLAESYINLNLIAGDGGTYFLPRLIGAPRALELFWTGREVTAAEAAAMGLVNHVVPNTSLRQEALALAHRIARQPQDAVRAFKRVVYQGASMSLAGHLDMLSAQMAVLVDTPNHEKAIDAFLARRGQR